MGQFTPAVCLGLAGWDPMYNAGSGNTHTFAPPNASLNIDNSWLYSAVCCLNF